MGGGVKYRTFVRLNVNEMKIALHNQQCLFL